MNREKKLLGYYNYTVVLTYVGMVTGFFGIVYGFEKNITGAVFSLMIAGVCDMFDGTIASTMERSNQEKCFGIQIDSLSDLICFGVLPASIVYNLSNRSDVILGICAMYILCGLIRLAYFNVDEQERQKSSSGSRELYYGMPVTLSALFLPMVYGGISLSGRNIYWPMVLTLLIMGVLFLLPIPIKKPKILGKICMLLCGVLEILFMVFACVDM